jgi:glutaredoxin
MLTLTKEELQEIAGCKQKKKLKLWLYKQGIEFVTDVDDFPRVSRELVSEKLKGKISLSDAPRKRGNVAALKEMMGIK